MSNNINNYNTSNFATLKTTWIKQTKYNLATDENNSRTVNTHEKFGAFSISAAVKGSCHKCYQNPWYRHVPGVS